MSEASEGEKVEDEIYEMLEQLEKEVEGEVCKNCAFFDLCDVPPDNKACRLFVSTEDDNSYLRKQFIC